MPFTVTSGDDHPADSGPQLCVLVPTRNEAGNVRPLVTRVAAALEDVAAEILFVDDSTDETPDVVESVAAAAPLPVRLVHRSGPDRTGGLGGAVVAGLDATQAPWVVVMDGDLQHPPELLPELVDQAESGAFDLVVASRYEDAGSAQGLSSPLRMAVSRAATMAAKLLFPRRLAAVSDPMTGFFAVRRDALNLQELRPRGFKVLLEILARTPRLRVTEVPFVFGSRESGRSKASGREGLRYVGQLASLRLAAFPALAGLARFALVGASGVLVNLLALAAVLQLVPRPVTGAVQAAAETAVTQLAVLWNFALAELWVFPGRTRGLGRYLRFAGYWAISMSALVVQLPLAAWLTRVLPVSYVVATGLALVALVLARYAVCSLLLYARPGAVADVTASGRHIRGRLQGARRGRLGRVVLFAVLTVSAGATWLAPFTTATSVVVLISGVLLAVSLLSVSWQTYAWRTPDTFRRTGLADLDEPELSFSVLVPARHEEAVLGATLAGIAAMDHPNFEVVVVVGHDDPGTRAVAEAAAGYLGVAVKVITDWHEDKNKPKALNTGLPHCSGDVVMVIDAEDDVQPGLLRLTDTAFRSHAADIVQTGVQLVDFDKSWWTARNVLEYFFWFRSRLHFHAAQRFITLGGTSVAIRRDLLEHLGGWDEACLAEDCDLGVRASSIGARVRVVYEPGHTTLEETPPDVRAFFRQRVRWMQGFMQVLAKDDWRRLPTRRQRIQAATVLATPITQSFAAIAAPVSALTALLLEAPVLIVLFTFLPLVPTVIGLAFDLAGLSDFGRTFSRRVGWRAYLLVVLSLPAYQLLLSSAALWAAVRQARGLNNWSKTVHVNAHRDVVIDLREFPA